jgi:hypothetical protein
MMPAEEVYSTVMRSRGRTARGDPFVDGGQATMIRYRSRSEVEDEKTRGIRRARASEVRRPSGAVHTADGVPREEASSTSQLLNPPGLLCLRADRRSSPLAHQCARHGGSTRARRTSLPSTPLPGLGQSTARRIRPLNLQALSLNLGSGRARRHVWRERKENSSARACYIATEAACNTHLRLAMNRKMRDFLMYHDERGGSRQ